MVKAYGQQQMDDATGPSQRTHGVSITFDGDFRRNSGALQFDGLHGSAVGPMSASSRPSGLVADRSAAFWSGRELPHGLGIHSSSASANTKADSPRVASFAFEGSSPKPPPLQVASLGAYDPAYHVAVKPTTYILHPSPESPQAPRPQTTGSHVAASSTSPRTASASYKRARQPSTGSAAHRPAAPPSLTVASSPRSKLSILDMEISATGLHLSQASHVGSPRQQQPSVSSAGAIGAASLDSMLITGRAATPRNASRASIGAMYAELEHPPHSPRTAHTDELASIVLEPRHQPQSRKWSGEQRAPTLLDRVVRNRATSNTPERRVSAAKLRQVSARRIPTGLRPGSSRLPAALVAGDAAALSVQSLGISTRKL